MTAGPLVVRADLALSVGAQSARLTGDGADLTLTSSGPVGLWRSATSAPWPVGITARSGPRAVGELGDLLAAHGLHLDVRGPQGRVAELGRGVSSPVGRTLTGSAGVRLGSPRVLVGTLAGEPFPWGPVVAALVAVLLVRGVRRR
ncbi:MAG: hypothetical protein JWQ53_771 [Klenkia sp.]|nr:hypothetical protein [Klenkia sp.]